MDRLCEKLEGPDADKHLFRLGRERNTATTDIAEVMGTLLSPGNSPREIAIKKTWPESRDRNFEMIFLTGISRERHKNIVQMIYAFSNKRDDRICESFVFDFMPDTLGSLIENNTLDLVDMKLYTWQMFNGLQYLCQLQIMHRDIKPVNILVDHPPGLLKIGDFGSAKVVRPGMTSTPYQVTRFYRPPELLLGSETYNWTVDIWSAGCVLGEMIKGNVLFPGRDTKHQLKLIRRALGSPTEADLKDESKVKTKLSSILMKTKLDFSCDDESKESREVGKDVVKVK
ncbi:kinase domain protein [Ancylostoma ceylanicum]|uniref:Kinase domain protein n=1 Tax=Ancylostoma ceylanicum TaxID=53326 RepID=A0A0D6LKK8_9BILA|nr:kinase domain protein [Ancylostoma ceylanicum]